MRRDARATPETALPTFNVWDVACLPRCPLHAHSMRRDEGGTFARSAAHGGKSARAARVNPTGVVLRTPKERCSPLGACYHAITEHLVFPVFSTNRTDSYGESAKRCSPFPSHVSPRIQACPRRYASRPIGSRRMVGKPHTRSTPRRERTPPRLESRNPSRSLRKAPYPRTPR